MPIRPEDVPSDPARLVAMVLALDTENERLRAIVRTLKDLLFGARSEKAAVIDVAQLPLDLDDLPEVRLPNLRRSGRPGQEPAPPHRGWHGHNRADHPCRGLQVRLAHPAVSAGSNLQGSRRAPRPLDPGAVDEASCVVAEAAL